MPVIETGVGNCHVYVDAAADPDQAVAIVVNAKTQRPSVCNAAETLLVHQDLVDTVLPRLGTAPTDAGVTLHAEPRRCGPGCRGCVHRARHRPGLGDRILVP